jgi:hypothetical protein
MEKDGPRQYGAMKLNREGHLLSFCGHGETVCFSSIVWYEAADVKISLA